jgi:hypothetical protein
MHSCRRQATTEAAEIECSLWTSLACSAADFCYSCFYTQFLSILLRFELQMLPDDLAKQLGRMHGFKAAVKVGRGSDIAVA